MKSSTKAILGMVGGLSTGVLAASAAEATPKPDTIVVEYVVSDLDPAQPQDAVIGTADAAESTSEGAFVITLIGAAGIAGAGVAMLVRRENAIYDARMSGTVDSQES